MVESVPKLVLAAVFSAMLRLFMKVMSVGDSSLRIKVTDANLHTFSKSFDFTITNIDDTAPTDIQLSNKTLVKGQAADT
jgi:hypothetical protein